MNRLEDNTIWLQPTTTEEFKGMAAGNGSPYILPHEDINIYVNNWGSMEEEIRNFFNVDVKDETVKSIRKRIEQTMLNNLRPKMFWIKDNSSHIFPAQYYCSSCGNDELYKTPFCPQCGAMEVKE